MSDSLLRDALEKDPAYAAALADGSNGTLLELLHADDPKAAAWQRLTADEIKSAIGPSLRQMDLSQLARLQVLLTGGETIDVTNDALRTELLDCLQVDPAAQERLTTAATRPARMCERYGFAAVTLDDLGRILPTIPTSLVARFLRDEFVDPVNKADNDAKRSARLETAAVEAEDLARAMPDNPEFAKEALAARERARQAWTEVAMTSGKG